MSTPRRLFEDPRNSYLVENDDPGAFDKRFAGRPGTHREQRCCGDRAPVWQTYLIHDGDDPGDGNRPAPKTMAGLQVEDATGESDNATGRNQMKGYVWVEGPDSGYRPDFVTPDEWMRWQSVYWIPSPRPVSGLPNPPRWVRVPGERKVRGGATPASGRCCGARSARPTWSRHGPKFWTSCPSQRGVLPWLPPPSLFSGQR